jgi:hypothetical protein
MDQGTHFPFASGADDQERAGAIELPSSSQPLDDEGCAGDKAIISKTWRLCKANLVQGEAELRSRCAFCCGRVQRGREPERANSGSAEAREQELRRIPAEHLSHGGLCLAVRRKYEWKAKMFHVKHFRRPFVGKFCTVDRGGLWKTP